MRRQQKQTTKVTLAIVVGVVVFGLVFLWNVWRIAQSFIDKGTPTVNGPEATTLTSLLNRKIYAVTTTGPENDESRIDEIDPSAGKIKAVLTAKGSIASLSEAHGLIAYMLVHFDAHAQHELRLYDGSMDRVLKSWKSDFWAANGSDGIERGANSMALSPDGKWLATVVRQSTEKANDEGDGGDGSLTITNLSGGKSLLISKNAVDLGLSWFPDGRHVAFVQACEKSKAKGIPHIDFGIGMGAEYLCIVSVVDVATGSINTVCGGSDPLISEDGSRMLVSHPSGGHCMLVSLRDKSFVELPDTSGSEQYGSYTPIALINNALVVALASPTRRNDSDNYRKHFVLKVIDFHQHVFQTITEEYAGTVARYGN